MKKIIIFSVVLALMATTSSFAATVTSSGGFLDLTTAGTLTSGMKTKIGLSPKVSAYYVTTGVSDVTAQWYAISTGHPGGNVAYGTAQDLNNLYSKTFSTGTDTITTVIAGIPQSKASASVWATWAD